MSQVELNISAGIEQVGEPWIWRLSKDFNLRVIIKKATVSADSGWMLLMLEGPVEELQRATAWLMTTGLRVEAMQRALAHD